MNKAPKFTDEQIAYLVRLLTPYCCHTTGMHDPEHFARAPEDTCSFQDSAAWERAVDALGLRERIPRAVSDPECGWCTRARQQAQEERVRGSLPSLASILRQCADLSAKPGPNVNETFKAYHDGARYGVQYEKAAMFQGIENCSRVLLHLPKFLPTAPIPSDGYPAKRARLSDEEEAALVRLLRDAGATVVKAWGGGEWLTIAIANQENAASD